MKFVVAVIKKQKEASEITYAAFDNCNVYNF